MPLLTRNLENALEEIYRGISDSGLGWDRRTTSEPRKQKQEFESGEEKSARLHYCGRVTEGCYQTTPGEIRAPSAGNASSAPPFVPSLIGS